MTNAKIWVSPTETSGFASAPSAQGPHVQNLPPVLESTLASVEAYGRANPLGFGLMMLGVGFVLGWKLKFF